MILTAFLEKMMKAKSATLRQLDEVQIEQLLNLMSEGDPKARKLVIDLVVHFGEQGIMGQNMIALLAAFHSIGFRGQALIQAFEAKDYDLKETCYGGIFALIHSQFPFVNDPFAKPEVEAG